MHLKVYVIFIELGMKVASNNILSITV